ncbi:uncharacterized protein LOC123307055 [Coccinella septempunctata]|uniref:uncharacterized protein LOC123307055 n=1 Tax=Coccinella septempunctata TaxID=41139 RepID=UPI001D09518E|nr:uncharacterized protein LOC123307055 [Coccinella septempunctata]
MQTRVIDTIRIPTWNIGSLTGRSSELSEILKRRNNYACCVQKTKWKGSRSKDIGLGYKLIYQGVDAKRNGVAIILTDTLKDRLINVERKSDRLIAVKIALDDQPPINICICPANRLYLRGKYRLLGGF